MKPTATAAIGPRQSCSSWAPATNQTAAKKDPPAAPQLTKDDGGAAVAIPPSSASKLPQQSPSPPLPSMQDEANTISNPNADEADLLWTDPMTVKGEWWGTTDASRCRHLEDTMFPRFLSLDCKQIDDLCIGCVKDRPSMKNFGRIYMEALHLKEFLMSQESIKLPNYTSSNGSVKRGRKNVESSKKKSRLLNDEHVTDNNRLSQSYFGGLEGKRTWFLANSHKGGKGGGVAGSYCQVLPSSTLNIIEHENESNRLKISGERAKVGAPYSEMDNLLSSEAKLASLRKDMRLNNQTVPFDSSENAHSELTRLQNLLKPLPGYIPPSQTKDDRKVSNEGPKGPEDSSRPMDIDGKSNENSYKIKSNERIDDEGRRMCVEPESPISSKDTLQREGSSPSHCPKIEDRRIIPSMDRHAKLGNIPTKSHNQPETYFDRAIREGNESALSANMLFESFSRNRRNFWAHKLKSGKTPKCAWCPSSSDCSVNEKASSKFEFGVLTDGVESSKSDKCVPVRQRGATGDSIIQCLECGLVGCAPRFLNGGKGGNQHVMLHFLMSGHRFGVTCGPLGELFCFGCGDIVYHECFDQERERVFLEQNIPSLCWRETPILRGVDPSSFIVTPEHGIVWRGMMATYPAPVSIQLVQASRFASKRLSIFRGDISDRFMETGLKAAELSAYQELHLENRWIPSPVGMYNLGSSCFMSATLQCMIHCKPLQKAFLLDLAHPYQSCDALRCGSNNTSCLTCEMDKLFLEHYGSAIGIDTIAALEEQRDLSSDATPNCVKTQTRGDRGHPIVPSSLMAEIWKNKGMKHVAGHSQHDAQEFFNAFVNCLAIHALSHQKSALEMRQIMHETQIKQSCSDEIPNAKTDTDLIRKIFGGTLRSVLICQKCGCKRTQTESFSNVSLPLAKEFPATDKEGRSSTRRGRISVQSVLNHFTRPEILADPVYCPSCSSKTKTLKQHAFSKLPDVLCLHLKRFDAAANKKITDFVAFPAHGLDMGKHLPHWRERGIDVKGRTNGECSAESPKVLYDLFGTVNHKGTLHQGHYVANVKCGNQWYTCNDAFVTTAGKGDDDGEKEVLSSEGAYMLFYTRW